MNIPNPYRSKHYRLLLLVPVALIALSVGLIFFGPGIKPGIDFKGGMLITVQYTQDVDVSALGRAIERVAGQAPTIRHFQGPAGQGVEIELPLKESLDEADGHLARVHALQEEYDLARIAVSQGTQTPEALESIQRQLLLEARQTVAAAANGATLKATDATEAVAESEKAVADARSEYRQSLLDAVQSVVNAASVSVREVGSSLSVFFFSKLREVVLVSLLLLGVIVFLLFRSIGPSLAVMIGPLTDIVLTAGAMSFLQIPWNLGSVAAMLMLIGFSLDSYVMLTVRILKRKEMDGPARTLDATKTAFLMNAAQVTGFGVLTALALVLQLPIYFQIGFVATLGGMADFFTTWFGNGPLLLWMSQRQEGKQK
ncbi:hypothetical protein HY572_02140 [Candidatus Micrarchaeota archaeon]|nr:hypothetical protein [Candidatus Micrarchaeota archaeon]